MNILVTINSNYRYHLAVMVKSLMTNNPGEKFDIYVLNRGLNDDDKEFLNNSLISADATYHFISVPTDLFEGAPTEKRYPHEIYFRIFSFMFLPENVDKVLYLDPDLVVNKSIRNLYDMDFEGNYFIATTHVRKFMLFINRIRMGAKKENVYMNTGVMMMNLKELKEVVKKEEIYAFIKKKKHSMILPDQDILYALYGDKVKLIDDKIYNLSDRMIAINNLSKKNVKIDKKWVEENNVIVHFYGRNKPWKPDYDGILQEYYDKYRV